MLFTLLPFLLCFCAIIFGKIELLLRVFSTPEVVWACVPADHTSVPVAMPTLVNYSGDDEFNGGSSFYSNSMDMGRLLSVNSNVDVYFPPSKRARFTAPFVFGRSDFKLDTKPSIEVLPDECLFEIFRRLQSAKERSSCACVSKRWLMLMSSIRRTDVTKGMIQSIDNMVESISENKIADLGDVEMVNSNEDQVMGSDGYLTRCLEGKKATDVRLAAIAIGTGGRGGLGKLSILGSNATRGVTDLGLTAIARCCPSLRTLSLWNVSSVGDEGLLEIAKECHLLEKLDLCQCPSISNKGLIAIAERCPNLSVLNIESCGKIGNEGLLAIGKLSSKLQSISIRDCPLVGDHGVSSLLTSASFLPTKVKLQGLNISDFCLAVIGHYGTALTNLILSGLQRVSEKGFWVMGNGRGLKKLSSMTITSCRGITDVSLAAMAKGFTSLKHMCLRKCCFVSDHGLVNFAKSAGLLEGLHLEECNRVTIMGINGAISNLKSLILVKCMGIKDESLKVPISSQSSLRSLVIRNCPGFGSDSLSMIGKFCPLLQHVELSGLCSLTNDGILPLFESSKGLVKVNLNGCSNLTDAAVVAMARLHGGTLEKVNLEGCRRITDASLVSISDYCLSLNELDVSNCAVSDSGLAILSRADQISLRVLSLSGCSGVSNKSLRFLKRLGKTLVGLNLQNCHAISSTTVELLMESLWRCDILI